MNPDDDQELSQAQTAYVQAGLKRQKLEDEILKEKEHQLKLFEWIQSKRHFSGLQSWSLEEANALSEAVSSTGYQSTSLTQNVPSFKEAVDAAVESAVKPLVDAAVEAAIAAYLPKAMILGLREPKSGFSQLFIESLAPIAEGKSTSYSTDEGCIVYNNDRKKCKFGLSKGSNVLIFADESLFANRMLGHLVLDKITSNGNIVISPSQIKSLVELATATDCNVAMAKPGLEYLAGMMRLAGSQLLQPSSDGTYFILSQLFKGRFSMDQYLTSNGLNTDASLNIFSAVPGGWPLSLEEVTTEWVLRVIYSWELVLEYCIGGKLGCLTATEIFQDVIKSCQSGNLSRMPPGFVLEQLNAVLYQWFSRSTDLLNMDGLLFAFTANSARILLRDMLNSIKQDPSIFATWQDRYLRGTALLCHLRSKISFRVGSPPPSKFSSSLEPSPYGNEICLANLTTEHLGYSLPPGGLRCYSGSNGICSRKHGLTQADVVHQKTAISSMIGRVRNIDQSVREDLLEMLNKFE